MTDKENNNFKEENSNDSDKSELVNKIIQQNDKDNNPIENEFFNEVDEVDGKLLLEIVEEEEDSK